MKTLEYTINRKVKGSKTFYFPTLNNKRFNSTNFARKYDAKNLVKELIKIYGIEKIIKLSL